MRGVIEIHIPDLILFLNVILHEQIDHILRRDVNSLQKGGVLLIIMQWKPHKNFFIESIENQYGVKVSSHRHIRPLSNFFTHWLEIDLADYFITLNVDFIIK